MPKFYTDCVQSYLDKGKSKDEAQAICAATFYEKFGYTVKEWDEKHKSGGSIELIDFNPNKNDYEIVDTSIPSNVSQESVHKTDDWVSSITFSSVEIDPISNINVDKISKVVSSINNDMDDTHKILDLNKDLMYIKGFYVHEGSNKNLDQFLYEELKSRHITAKFKPLNWEHYEDRIIGVIFDTEFKDNEQASPSNVIIHAVVYKWLFPEIASEIKKRYDSNDLFLSMEVWFKKAECSVCNKTFSKESEYCEHLKDRYSTKAATRILRDMTFGGCAITKTPADPDAVGLAVAKQLKATASKISEIFEKTLGGCSTQTPIFNDGDIMSFKVFETEQDFDLFLKEDKAVLDIIDNAASAAVKAIEEKLNPIIADKDKEINSLKASIDQLTLDVDTRNKEIATLKATYEAEKIIASRKKALIDAGIAEPSEEDLKVIASVTDDVFNFILKTLPKEDLAKASKNTPFENENADGDEKKFDIELAKKALRKVK